MTSTTWPTTTRMAGRLRRLRSRRFIVEDRSMAPGLLPGDRVWVDPRGYAHELPRPGDVVVLRDPEVAGRLLLKRISSVEFDPVGDPVSVRVLGDLREESRDSRAFGDVPVGALVGVAWYRYFPLARRGPL